MQLAAGSRIGSYEVLGPLGSGGMGEVYRALDSKLQRTVALKILKIESAGDPCITRRFVQEARAASSLNHQNIAHIYEVGENSGVMFIAMEYVEGETLANRTGGRPQPTAEIVSVGAQIADALDEAHSKGIVHR